MSSSIVKVVFPGSDIRRFALPQTGVYEHLLKLAKDSLGQAVEQIRLSYIDDEEDHCQVTTEDEMKEALRVASLQKGVPKFFLTVAAGENLSATSSSSEKKANALAKEDDDAIVLVDSQPDVSSVQPALDAKAQAVPSLLKFVKDMTFEDGAVATIDVPHSKTWRVQNPGTTAWPADAYLTLVKEKSSSSFFANVATKKPVAETPVAPGAEVDVSVDFKLAADAPLGAHKGVFALCAGAGDEPAKPFEGDLLWVSVKVEPKLNAVFVSDANLPDGCDVAPEAEVIKAWTVKNTGQVAFPPTARLVFMNGDLEPVSSAPVPPAAVGEEVQVQATFRVPVTEGKATGHWQLAEEEKPTKDAKSKDKNAKKKLSMFGPDLWAAVNVKVPRPSTEDLEAALVALRKCSTKRCGRDKWDKCDLKEAGALFEKGGDKSQRKAKRLVFRYITKWLDIVTPATIVAAVEAAVPVPAPASSPVPPVDQVDAPASSSADMKAADADGEVVHRHIKCDGCGVKPVVGTRFKCTTCPNFDLCSACEAKGDHPVDHVLIKCRHVLNARHCEHGPWRRGGGRCGGRGGRGGRGGFLSKVINTVHGLFGASSTAATAEVNWRGRKGEEETGGDKAKLKMTFVKDATLDDGSVVRPSSVLTKTWTIKNSGSAAWPPATVLQFTGGDLKPTANSASRPLACEAGQAVDVSVDIKTPDAAGRYTGYYRPSLEGRRFGDRLWVDVLVTSADGKVPADQPVKNLEKEARAAEKALKDAEKDAERAAKQAAKELARAEKEKEKNAKRAEKEVAKQSKKEAKEESASTSAANPEPVDAKDAAEEQAPLEKEAMKEAKRTEKEKEKEQARLEKEAAKEAKKAEKEKEKEQARLEKEKEKEQARLEKEKEKEQARLEKEKEKEQARLEKEAKKAEKEKEKTASPELPDILKEAKRAEKEASKARKASNKSKDSKTLTADAPVTASAVAAPVTALVSAPVAAPATTLPAEDERLKLNLDMLFKMGFTDRNTCKDLLLAAKGDISTVVNWLLTAAGAK